MNFNMWYVLHMANICELKQKGQGKPCGFIWGKHLNYLCGHPDHEYYYCIERLMLYPVIRRSMVEDIEACPRKFYYNWIKGIELKEPNLKMKLGSSFGAGLAKIHDERLNFGTFVQHFEDKVNRRINQLTEVKVNGGDVEYRHMLQLASMAFLQAYIESDKYINPTNAMPFDRGVPEYYMEHDFKDSDDVKLILHGHADLYMEHNKHTHIDDCPLLEFKYGNTDYYTKFRTYWQSTIYLFLTQANGIRYRVFKRLEYKLKKNETVDAFYNRCKEIATDKIEEFIVEKRYYKSEYFTPEGRKMFKAALFNNVTDIKTRLQHAVLEGFLVAFTQRRANCHTFGQDCQFLKICENNDKISNRYQRKKESDI